MRRADPYFKIREKKNLRRAWHFVKASASRSPSATIKSEIQKFEPDAESELSKIQKQLQKSTFTFPPAKGIPAKKKGKNSIRPIVLAPLVSRIVQRAILNVLNANPSIKAIVKNQKNFGGVEDGGVEAAIRAARTEIKKGATWFYRSDIAGFFQKIPRSVVLNTISSKIDNPAFIKFLSAAVDVEISNMEEIRQHLDEFPIREVGVAQGCCLSPLLGNIFLAEFDDIMNADGVTTIRYIDDLIILSQSNGKVEAAFKKAQAYLGQHGMKLYEAKANPEKAAHGRTENRFDFLGCEFHSKMIRPNENSRKRFFSKVKNHFTQSIHLIRDKKTGFGAAIWKASHIVNGWAKHYSFCDDHLLMRDIDRKLDDELNNFMGHFRGLCKGKDQNTIRSYVGLVFAEEAVKRKPKSER